MEKMSPEKAKTKDQMKLAMLNLQEDNEALLDRTLELEDQVHTLTAMLAERYHRHIGDRSDQNLRVDSVDRDAQGRVKVRDGLPTYEERMKARKDASEYEAARIKASRTEGLEPGLWRDPTGLVRNQAGQVMGRALSDQDARKSIDAAIAEEHREFLEAQGVSRRDRTQAAAKAERKAEQALLRGRTFTAHTQGEQFDNEYDPLDSVVD